MNNGKDEEKIPDNRTHSVCTFSNIRELSNNYCTVKVIGQKADIVIYTIISAVI